jgi:hypothetical protein
VERTVRGFRRADPDREVAEAQRQFEGRYLHARHDEHGNVIVEARLPAELGERLLAALDAATDATRASKREAGADGSGASPAGDLRSEPPITPTQRRADALVLLADSAVAAGLPGRRAADTHHVVVHVDAAVLADPAEDGRSELERGGHVSAETSRRLACDASVVEVREDAEGATLSVGRARRSVPPALRRALSNRDPVCRFPGCEHGRFLEAHNVRHWANGGETSLENLVHLCSFHHRELHEGGFRIEDRAGGDLRFVSRYGLVFEQAPSASAAVAVEELLRDQEGLAIDGGRLPVWTGDSIDYGMAVAALCSAAAQTT